MMMTDIKTTSSSDVKTQQSPWDELKTDNTTESQQETTTTDTQQKTAESSELEEKQGTPTISHNCYYIPGCLPPDNCWVCDN
ncbi:MAG: hypothetical protein F6J89_12475 [Symploca sp. SIO1C4]|uniref:Uncharacterized protein n=1 Tax=Symploca sp. SIO1C4 TaxID=2607765 RepID=A0A6B3NGK2_9CYAN|nr:hypothetical protein [Symploca sp. SIO1C4]